MSNSSLVEYTKISPYRATRNHVIDTVSIHCVVGQCTAESLGNTFQGTRKASSNYGVDKDGRVGMYVEEKDRSMCTSSTSNDDRAITIEVASDRVEPYAVTEAAYEGLIKLLVDICQRNPGIHRLRWQGDRTLIGQVDKQNMTVHRWFHPSKSCPGEFLYTRHGAIAGEVNRRLDELEDENMDVTRFSELWKEMRSGLQDNDASAWSQESRDWAVNTGLISGGNKLPNGESNYMWGDMLSREEFVTVLYRFAKLMGKA